MSLFPDRREAGRALGAALLQQELPRPVLVLALWGGGLVLAAEVARALGVPFDVLTLGELRFPGRDGPVLGIIASGGVRVLNHELISRLGITATRLNAIAASAERRLAIAEARHRPGRPVLDPDGATAILVAEGLANAGRTLAAINVLRQLDASEVVVALPHADRAAAGAVRQESDVFLCLHEPEPYLGCAHWYRRFPPVPDDELLELLESGEFERQAP